jgi:hypothetical protein
MSRNGVNLDYQGGVEFEHEAQALFALFLLPLYPFDSFVARGKAEAQFELMDQGRNLLNSLFDSSESANQDSLENRAQGHQQSTNTQYMNPSAPQATQGGSPSITPLSSGTANSGGSNLNDGRQNLLSLLNTVPGAPANREYQSRQADPSSPPTQSKTTNTAMSTESQGKKLLEQLMSECVSSL